MFQRNIIKGAAVHLASIFICLKPRTFFVKYTFESGRDLPEARDIRAAKTQIPEKNAFVLVQRQTPKSMGGKGGSAPKGGFGAPPDFKSYPD